MFCGRSPTFAGAIWSPQHSALVYAAKRLKQPPDILIALLLSQHAHKQLPVLCGNKDARDLKSGHTSAVQTVNTVSTDRDVSMKACFFFSLSLHQGAVLPSERRYTRPGIISLQISLTPDCVLLYLFSFCSWFSQGELTKTDVWS